jgi:hypothetical protein
LVRQPSPHRSEDSQDRETTAVHPVSVLKPIRLTIPGEYWDSQVYSGALYLFGQSGELVTLSWDRLVEELPVPTELRVAANAALLGNHTLYEPGARQLVEDPEIGPILIKKFLRLASELTDWQPRDLSRARTEDNLLPFPHNDSEIHYNQLYVGATDGLYGLESGETRRSGKDVVRYSDVPALDIAAKFRTIAQACGSEGLLEVRVPADKKARTLRGVFKLSQTPCVRCEWAYSSVIASGYDATVYLASFRRVRSDQVVRAKRNERQFDRVIPSSEMFANVSASGFTWGARDKIYRYAEGRIEVVRYSPNTRKTAEPKFEEIGNIEVASMTDTPIVSARVAPFGCVIEHDEGLLVIPTIGDPMFLPGEPTNWRVFPRSVDYLNQLHVVYEDRLEVYAFTHDYFIDQRSKLAGIEVSASAEA